MRTGVTDPALLARTAVTATATVRTFPLAAGGPEHDPVLALLDDVSCRHDGRRSIVRLAHLFLTRERRYLADRLRQLAADGCDVRLVGHLKNWNADVRRALVAPGPGRIDLRSAQGTALHTKITTVDGWNAAGERIRVGMVGTHNLTGRALSVAADGVNDEVSLTVAEPATLTAYDHWVDQLIRRHSRSAGHAG